MRKSVVWMIISAIIFVGGIVYGVYINDGKTVVGFAFVGFLMMLAGLVPLMLTGEDLENISNAF